MEYQIKVEDIKAAIGLGMITHIEASVLLKEAMKEFNKELEL